MLPGSTELIKQHLIKLLGETKIEAEQKLITMVNMTTTQNLNMKCYGANVKDVDHLSLC